MRATHGVMSRLLVQLPAFVAVASAQAWLRRSADEFAQITTGRCSDYGLTPILTSEECQAAVSTLGLCTPEVTAGTCSATLTPVAAAEITVGCYMQEASTAPERIYYNMPTSAQTSNVALEISSWGGTTTTRTDGTGIVREPVCMGYSQPGTTGSATMPYMMMPTNASESEFTSYMGTMPNMYTAGMGGMNATMGTMGAMPTMGATPSMGNSTMGTMGAMPTMGAIPSFGNVTMPSMDTTTSFIQGTYEIDTEATLTKQISATVLFDSLLNAIGGGGSPSALETEILNDLTTTIRAAFSLGSLPFTFTGASAVNIGGRRLDVRRLTSAGTPVGYIDIGFQVQNLPPADAVTLTNSICNNYYSSDTAGCAAPWISQMEQPGASNVDSMDLSVRLSINDER